MEKIASFCVDHVRLQPGLYVSRKDSVGAETVTTFDIRVTSPNDEPCMCTAEVHTFEHIAATYLRNDPDWKDKIIYFGPMGCRTGFYLVMAGDLESKDILDLIIKCFEFCRDFEGEIPGQAPEDCGNWLDHNLPMAKYWAKKYLDRTLYQIDDAHLTYPVKENTEGNFTH